MVQAAIVQQILGAIFGFQYLVDIIIGIFLLSAFFIGVKRGIWRSLWRLIFVVLVLVLVNIFALPALTDFIDTGVWTLTGMSLTLELPPAPAQTSTSLHSIIFGFRDYADAVGNLPLASIFRDDDFMMAFSLALARTIGWIIVVLVTMLVSWIVSGLFWLIIWGPLLKSVKNKKVGFLGGLLGAAQGYIYALVLAISFSPIAGALAAIENPAEPPYAFGDIVPLAAGGLLPENSLILSITDVKNPFGMFTGIASFEHEGTPYSVFTVFIQFVQETGTDA